MVIKQWTGIQCMALKVRSCIQMSILKTTTYISLLSSSPIISSGICYWKTKKLGGDTLRRKTKCWLKKR